MTFEHGTLIGYNRHGCRCEACKDVIRGYNARRKRKLSRLPINPLEIKLSKTNFSQKYKGSFDTWYEMGIDVFKADRICCEYGYHPYEVWGDEWFLESWKKTHITRDETSIS